MRQDHSSWRKKALRGQDRKENHHFRATIVHPNLSYDNNEREETRRQVLEPVGRRVSSMS